MHPLTMELTTNSFSDTSTQQLRKNSSCFSDKGIPITRKTLDEWNYDLTLRLIPNDVILIIYFIVGVFGNIIVICVYRYRFHGHHDDRYFIPVLAVADLLACISCCTFTFYLNFFQASFGNVEFCKSMWFLSTVTTFMSVLTLLTITIERYIKVCRPFCEIKHKRVIVMCIILMSLLIASPSPLFFGKSATFIPSVNLTRYRCTVVRDLEKNGPVIYAFVLGFFSILTPISIAVVYIRIGCKLHHQLRFRKQFVSHNQMNSTKVLKGNTIGDILFHEKQNAGKYLHKIQQNQPEYDTESTNSTEYNHDDTNPRQSQIKQIKGDKRHNFFICGRKMRRLNIDIADSVGTPIKRFPKTHSSSKYRLPHNHKEFHFTHENCDFHLKELHQQHNSPKYTESYPYLPENKTQQRDEKQTKSRYKHWCDITRTFENITYENLNEKVKTPTDIQIIKIVNQQPVNVNKTEQADDDEVNDAKGQRQTQARTTGHFNGAGSSVLERVHHTRCDPKKIHTLNESPNLRKKRNKSVYNSMSMHRFTIMFMLIGGLCCICYLPKIALLILEAVNKSFWTDIPDEYLGLVLFLYRFYIFNNICNPFIYCFFDPRFRREVKILLHRK